MKKPSPTNDATRERKREAKRRAVAEWMAADRFITIGIGAACLWLGFCVGVVVTYQFAS